MSGSPTFDTEKKNRNRGILRLRLAYGRRSKYYILLKMNTHSLTKNVQHVFTKAGFPLANIFARSDFFPLSLSFRLKPSRTNSVETKEESRFARKYSLVENRLKTSKTLRARVDARRLGRVKQNGGRIELRQ